MNPLPAFPAGPSVPRWPFVDALRIVAFALLVPYHVGMYYVSWGWHVKSATPVPALEPWMAASYPWRMSLLFLLSGTVLALMLGSPKGQGPWFRRRLARLGVPLVAGIVLVVPPQSYFEVRAMGYDGSFVEFLRLYFSAYGGFCKPGAGCLVLPTWNHLWFLVYLLAYTTLVALAWPRARPVIEAAARHAEALPGWLLLAAPVGWLVLTRLALRDRFPVSHAFVDDLYAHSQYLAIFALGLVLARAPAVWRRFDALRWTALVLAVAGWLGLVLGAPGRGLAGMLLISVQQWCAIVAACGFAHHHLDRDSAWVRRLTDAVLALYLLHQTVIIVAATALRPLALAPAIEGPLLVAIAFGASWAGYAGARRVRVLRPLIGLPARPAVPARGGRGLVSGSA